ncbi:MAG: DUF4296 domain-containing protein [Brumimicrobium sp.]|nr:DUF4296 domain-containing protein [Brumimicrobium sp.]
MKLFFYSIAFVLILIFASCGYQLEKVEKPDDLIPKDTFELLLEDMMLLESYVRIDQNNVHQFHRPLIQSSEIIFEKYGVDSSRYIRSMDYYAQKQEILLEMYENIQNRAQIDAVEAEEE